MNESVLMINPLTAIIVGAGIIFFIVFIFWPGTGIFFRKRRSKSNERKILIENSLKHLYNCEYEEVNCTVDSIAGHLSISSNEAAKLISELESHQLVEWQDDNLKLTQEGRSYALRIIRVHRLWERYLADETSVAEEGWHSAAEIVEHQMSPEQADLLAAQIGNPVFDPHGDPIPSTRGDLPRRKGKSLNTLQPGEFAHIIHVEDEPHAVYSQLVAEGLYRGMQVRMIENKKERIRFLANGEEVVLAPLFGKNITIAPITGEHIVKGKFKKLSSLAVGEKGKVMGISKKCRGQQRRRLMDLGVVPGTEIEVEMKSIGGDPVSYRIRGASIALRKNQADRIYMENEE